MKNYRKANSILKMKDLITSFTVISPIDIEILGAKGQVFFRCIVGKIRIEINSQTKVSDNRIIGLKFNTLYVNGPVVLAGQEAKRGGIGCTL